MGDMGISTPAILSLAVLAVATSHDFLPLECGTREKENGSNANGQPGACAFVLGICAYVHSCPNRVMH